MISSPRLSALMPSSRWPSKKWENASPSELGPLDLPLAKPVLERARGGFDLAPHQEDVARVHPGEPLGRRVAQLARDPLGLVRRGEGGAELAERRVRLGLPGADARPDGEHQPGRFRSTGTVVNKVTPASNAWMASWKRPRAREAAPARNCA